MTDNPLTNGQVAVLRLYADGNSYRETGALLGISESAVKNRCARAAERLGTNHIAHTVAVALRLGLLDEESPMSDAQTGAELIAAERVRQIEVEGWTLKHDVEHIGDDLSRAAACYALPYDWREPHGRTGQPPRMWPWRVADWKPTDRIRDLVKAGALIAAEIDRLQVQQGEQ